MVEYTIARAQHIESLRELYSSCFCVSPQLTDLFFENKFKLQKCVVCLVDGKVAAALHMFDAFIFKDLKKYPVCYIYAAATFPKYRGRGYMKNLINFSYSVARDKGCLYSFLLPASSSLYDFYEKLGYKTFFKLRTLELNYEDLRSFAGNSFDATNVEKVRGKFFCRNGDVFWQEEHIKYAILENKLCSGATFYTKNGYAICQISNDSVDVIEIAASKSESSKLLFKIFNEIKRPVYKFRLKADSEIFDGLGKVVNHGMIKCLSEKDKLNLFHLSCAPYLGLTLD